MSDEQTKHERAVNHAQVQAYLWRRCVELNTIHPQGSMLRIDGKEKEVTSDFHVVGSDIKVCVEGKQISVPLDVDLSPNRDM